MTVASARNVISQVILSMKSELPDPKTAEDSEQVELIHKIPGAMLDEVQMTDTGIEAERSHALSCHGHTPGRQWYSGREVV